VHDKPELAAAVTTHLAPVIEYALNKNMREAEVLLHITLDYFKCVSLPRRRCCDRPDRSCGRIADTNKKVDMAAAWLDHVVEVAHTHDGARIAMYCIAFSPPAVRPAPALLLAYPMLTAVCGGQGRKKLLHKKFSEAQAVLPMAQDEFGNRVLMTAFTLVDDTKLLGKALVHVRLSVPQPLAVSVSV
jgi:hypothetical protein